MKFDTVIWKAVDDALAHYGNMSRLAEAIGIHKTGMREYLLKRAAGKSVIVSEPVWERIYAIVRRWLPDSPAYMPRSLLKTREPEDIDPTPLEHYIKIYGMANATVMDPGTVYGDYVPDNDFCLDEIPVQDKRTCAGFKMFGQSMEPLILDGDIAVCAKIVSLRDLRNGDIVLVKWDDMVACKEVRLFGDRMALLSKNPAGESYDILLSDVVWILKVTGLVRKLG